MNDHETDQKRLEQEQALADLDQSIADREQALANVDQATIERDQSKLDEERAEVDPSDFRALSGLRASPVGAGPAPGPQRRASGPGRSGADGGDQRQTLLDDQQYELEQPRPAALTAAEVRAEGETRGQAARVRAANARARAEEALRRAEAAELRAQALQEREDTPAT